MLIKINLNTISEEEVNRLFYEPRLSKMYSAVVEYSYKEIPSYELTRIMGMKKMQFDVSVNNTGSGFCFIYVKDKIENKAYEFRY